MDDLTGEFLVETNESLDALDLDLVTLEQNPEDKETINNIFRVMHTIKGTCGFLGLPRLESVAHAAENIMDKIRGGAFSVTPGVVSLILEAIDRIKDLISHLEAEGTEPEGEDSDLIGRLNSCAETGQAGEGYSADGSKQSDAEKEAAKSARKPAEAEKPAESAAAVSKTPDLDGEIDFEPIPAPYANEAATGEQPAEQNAAEVEKPAENKTPDLDGEIDFEPVMAPYAGDDVGGDATQNAEQAADTAMMTQAEASLPEAEISEETKVEAVAEGLKTAAEEGGKKPMSGQSIRVGLDVLESLMQMVGELVLTRNQLLQMTRNLDVDVEFNTPLQRLNHITTDLQEGVMQTRMQPIGNAWAKFPRLIRDLALELGKKIELKMVGAETEIDRQMLEAIKDPLTHMVRNSADHGIEKIADRVKAGKGETGTVTLSAYHEGGHIIIKIADDGKGLDAEKIRKKAVQNGLATESEVNGMSDKQVYQFVFRPGFSTAEKVTSVSGRGVGMDVVVTNIEKIGGTVELNSFPKKGSEFIITLPLTLAIMPVLIVESYEEKFAIPQIRVSEIVRAEKPTANIKKSNEGVGYAIESINDAPVLRLRGRLLPLVSLSRTLKFIRIGDEDKKIIAGKSDGEIEPDTTEINEEKNAENINPYVSLDSDGEIEEPFVVVCEVGSQSFGIMVNKVFHTEEIVVKPVAKIMKSLEVYSGCTILGDGSVILILDPNGIIKTGGVLSMHEGEGQVESDAASEQEDHVSFLIFQAWGKSPRAVPLELVSRLEELDAGSIEWSGKQKVVQYRGGLMRLTTLDPETEIPDTGKLAIIVFADEDRVMGLVVQEIMDIVKQKMDIKSVTGKDGMLGSLVVNNITTDLVDVSYFFSQTFSGWMGGDDMHGVIAAAGGKEKVGKKHVLLVDDSPFFRKFMKPVLVVSDFNVTTAENAEDALKILDDNATKFDIVVTDIDMPGMSGVDFLKKCKKDERFSNLPFVAITSHNESDIGDTKQMGFMSFVTKSDRDKLVSVISNVLSGINKGESQAAVQ